jgi:hypothetical protein
MHSYLTKPNTRFCIALGATIGFGHALFRGLTENLGPIVGLLVFLPLITAAALGISYALERAVKRSAGGTPNESS